MTTSDYVRVGRVDDFAEGVIRAFTQDGLDIAVVSWRERFFAFENHCSHQGYPFDTGGYISPDNELICTSHFACYDLDTGQQLDGPGYSGVAVYDVKVDEGEVLVSRSPRGS